jgi:threonine dehydrogenase-like Zn-dependent dehydrogenase
MVPRMRALVLEQGTARIATLESPEPRHPDECRIDVLRAGVCATDLALARGYMGFSGVPGHEFVGRAVDGPLAGRRVVGEINAACPDCTTCDAVARRHCKERTVLGILGRPGAFAERLVLPTRNLIPIPDDLSDDAATFVEPVAAAIEIVEQLRPAAGTRTLVAGDGKLGLLCAQVLAAHGLDVVVAGRHPERADLLPADLGIEHRTGVLESDPGPGGAAEERFALTVEASGRPEVLPRLLARTAPRGTLVLKTTTERPVTLDLAPLVVDEITLVGSRCGPFAPAVELLASGRIAVEPLVVARYGLDDGVRALEHAGRRGTLKVLVDVAQAP